MFMCFHSVQAAAHAFRLLVRMAVRVASIVEFQLYNRSARKIEKAAIISPIRWERFVGSVMVGL
jgi:hypothetical protein